MRINAEHVADYEALRVQVCADNLDIADFVARHSELVRQVVCGNVEGDIVSEPG